MSVILIPQGENQFKINLHSIPDPPLTIFKFNRSKKDFLYLSEGFNP